MWSRSAELKGSQPSHQAWRVQQSAASCPVQTLVVGRCSPLLWGLSGKLLLFMSSLSQPFKTPSSFHWSQWRDSTFTECSFLTPVTTMLFLMEQNFYSSYSGQESQFKPKARSCSLWACLFSSQSKIKHLAAHHSPTRVEEGAAESRWHALHLCAHGLLQK